MEQLGRILANSALGHENQQTIKAAAIVAAASRTIQKELQFTPAEARAIAFRRGEVIVRVEHGAVGGKIMIYQTSLLEAINTAIKKIYPGQTAVVERIIVRNN